MPGAAQLESGVYVRGVGSLWAEWGNLTASSIISKGMNVYYAKSNE